MFKRYDCGCIGFKLCAGPKSPDEGKILVFKACDVDGSDQSIAIYARPDLENRRSVKLTDSEVLVLLVEVGVLVDKGYRYDVIRNMLGAVS